MAGCEQEGKLLGFKLNNVKLPGWENSASNLKVVNWKKHTK